MPVIAATAEGVRGERVRVLLAGLSQAWLDGNGMVPNGVVAGLG